MPGGPGRTPRALAIKRNRVYSLFKSMLRALALLLVLRSAG